MNKNALIKMLDSICSNFDTQIEYKLFLHILSNHLSNKDTVISYTQFVKCCNTNRNTVKRGLDRLLDKHYIFRVPFENSFRYRINEDLF